MATKYKFDKVMELLKVQVDEFSTSDTQLFTVEASTANIPPGHIAKCVKIISNIGDVIFCEKIATRQDADGDYVSWKYKNTIFGIEFIIFND